MVFQVKVLQNKTLYNHFKCTDTYIGIEIVLSTYFTYQINHFINKNTAIIYMAV